MKNHLYLFTLLLASLHYSGYSQKVDCVIHFPKGSAVPETESMDLLKQWISANLDQSNQTIVLRGHTDSDAGTEFNKELSQRRNENTEAVLRKNGFENIRYESYGENRPTCNSQDEVCMRENRRVEVIVCDTPEEKFGLGQQLKCPQVFFIDQNKGDVITGQDGTEIFIPKAAFVQEDGEVAENDVKIELREFYQISDCIKANLSTASHGAMLETGGMIEIEAYANGEKLKLAEDAAMQIVFASQKNKLQEGMQIFYGNAENEQMNWTNNFSMLNSNSASISAVEMLTYKTILYDDKVYFKSSEKEYFYTDLNEKMEIDSLEKAFKTAQGEELIAIKNKLEIVSKDQAKRREQYMEAQRKTQLQLSLANSLTAKGMGWINCDRFVDEKQLIDFVVDVPEAKGLMCYIYFDDINSLMQGYVSGPNRFKFFKIPEGKKGKILCYHYNEEMSLFDIKSVTTSRLHNTLTPKLTSQEDIEIALNGLEQKGK